MEDQNETGTGKEKPVSVLDYTQNILGVYLKNEHCNS
jgi:hypothetical protein